MFPFKIFHLICGRGLGSLKIDHLPWGLFAFLLQVSQPILSNVYSSTLLLGTALAGAALIWLSSSCHARQQGRAAHVWLSKVRPRCLLMRHCSEMNSRCCWLEFPPTSSSLGNSAPSSHIKIWLSQSMLFFVEMTICSLWPKVQAVPRPQLEPTQLKLLCRHLAASSGSQSVPWSSKVSYESVTGDIRNHCVANRPWQFLSPG